MHPRAARRQPAVSISRSRNQTLVIDRRRWRVRPPPRHRRPRRRRRHYWSCGDNGISSPAHGIRPVRAAAGMPARRCCSAPHWTISRSARSSSHGRRRGDDGVRAAIDGRQPDHSDRTVGPPRRRGRCRTTGGLHDRVLPHRRGSRFVARQPSCEQRGRACRPRRQRRPVHRRRWCRRRCAGSGRGGCSSRSCRRLSTTIDSMPNGCHRDAARGQDDRPRDRAATVAGCATVVLCAPVTGSRRSG